MDLSIAVPALPRYNLDPRDVDRPYNVTMDTKRPHLTGVQVVKVTNVGLADSITISVENSDENGGGRKSTRTYVFSPAFH